MNIHGHPAADANFGCDPGTTCGSVHHAVNSYHASAAAKISRDHDPMQTVAIEVPWQPRAWPALAARGRLYNATLDALVQSCPSHMATSMALAKCSST